MISVNQIDVNIVEHCNFSCANCSHVSPMLGKWEMSIADMERDLGRLKPILAVEHVNVVGGEPTLHSSLVDILRVLKSIRIDKATRVITNGSRLRSLPDDFWGALEILRFSDYGKLEPEIKAWIEKKADDHKFVFEYYHFPHFFRQFKMTPDDGVESFKVCEWKNTCHTVHRGRYYRCPQSTFFHRVLPVGDVNGLEITEGLTEDSLRAFIEGQIPLEACRYCMAATREPHLWKEAQRRGWLEESKAL